MVNLLNRRSLSETLGRINEAFFLGETIDFAEAAQAGEWIRGRLGKGIHYGGGFGLLPSEVERGVYTFTGEPLHAASMRHITTEEACRVLNLLKPRINQPMPELQVATDLLRASVRQSLEAGAPEGFFCCGPCSVAVWRHVNGGGLSEYGKQIPNGLKVLKEHRRGDGTWRRYPFYFTLSALVEMDPDLVSDELQYVRPRVNRLLKRSHAHPVFGPRRRAILERVASR